MKLPNAHLAVVEEKKVTEYLLNGSHRFGASKARFFAAFGFTAGSWRVFADALRQHGRSGEVASRSETGFGPRHEVDGPLAAPDGRRPRVRTVSQFVVGEVSQRAHPGVASGGVMIHEHDRVVLTADLPAPGLVAGDVGTVVHVHEGGAAYEVEFVTMTGRTVAVTTVAASQLRPVSRLDISHVRELAAK